MAEGLFSLFGERNAFLVMQLEDLQEKHQDSLNVIALSPMSVVSALLQPWSWT